MSKMDLMPAGLSGEFLRIGAGGSSEERLLSGLQKRCILEPKDRLISYQDVSPWHVGGGETYVADAVVEIDAGDLAARSRHVIGKALVSMGLPPGEMLAVWLQRRELLQQLGLNVPRLFSASEGTIYEEFIDESLRPGDYARPRIVEQVAKFAACLDQAGFETLSFLSDIRVSGESLYYVDFGFDLGDCGAKPTSSALECIKRSVADPYKESCIRGYWEFVGGGPTPGTGPN